MHNILSTESKGQFGTNCLDVFKDAAVLNGADLPEVDLSDRAQCSELLNELQSDLIVNCAAYTAVDACETGPSCWKADAELPGHLTSWSESNNAFLIHVSTDYVFSGDKPLFEAVVETDEQNPISEYRKSRLAGERAIAEKTKRFAILRTAYSKTNHLGEASVTDGSCQATL